MFGSVSSLQQAMFAAAAAALTASPKTSLTPTLATALASASSASTPQIAKLVNSPNTPCDKFEINEYSYNNERSGDFLVYLVSLPDVKGEAISNAISERGDFITSKTFSLESCCGNFGGIWTNHCENFFGGFQTWTDNNDALKPLIDTSTPETLERDFYAWLKGELRSTSARKCNMSESPLQDHTMTQSELALHPKTPNPVKMDPVPVRVVEWTGSLFREIKEEVLYSDGNSDGQSPPVLGSPTLSWCSYDSPQSSTTSLTEKSGNSTSLAAQSADRNSNRCALGVRLPSTCPIAIKTNLPSRSPDLATGLPTSRLQRITDSSGTRSCGTNQLGRTYSPGLPLSMDERKQIVEMHESGWKICDISKKLCVTHSCVSKILNRFRTTGSVRPKDAKEGRQESPLVVAIRDYRQRLGITRQSEIREQLIRDGMCKRENAPSRSSINHILRTKLNVRSNRPKQKVPIKIEENFS